VVGPNASQQGRSDCCGGLILGIVISFGVDKFILMILWWKWNNRHDDDQLEGETQGKTKDMEKETIGMVNTFLIF